MSIYESIRQMLVKNFHEAQNADEYLKAICNLAVPSKVFMDIYPNYTPLESLSDEEKHDIKKNVHEMFPGRSPEFKLRAAKILYTMANYIG